MNPAWVLHTGRAVLRPVHPADLSELQALKADPRVFAMLLGGVRTPARTAEELAEDFALWSARGVGMWSVRGSAGASTQGTRHSSPPRKRGSVPLDTRFRGHDVLVCSGAQDTACGPFLGIAGLMQRRDGLGLALRFAFWPEARGRGLAREAAGVALRFAHEQAAIPRVIAVARENNYPSRMVLGAIGMIETGSIYRDGHRLLVYASERRKIE